MGKNGETRALPRPTTTPRAAGAALPRPPKGGQGRFSNEGNENRRKRGSVQTNDESSHIRLGIKTDRLSRITYHPDGIPGSGVHELRQEHRGALTFMKLDAAEGRTILPTLEPAKFRKLRN